MHKRIFGLLAVFAVVFLFAGCATPTYEEKMHRVDFFYTQGRYSEAEKELANLAEEKAPEVIPGGAYE